MRADIHPRQAERLHILRTLDLLDSPREQGFDDIVALCARICEAPICLVTLQDAERQWFKAETGMGQDETPMEQSICSHAILGDGYTEIPDTTQDSRTVDNPLCVPADGVRFYAGAVFYSSSGVPLGTLCVLDRAPRQLSPVQRDALIMLSRQVAALIELRRSAIQAEAIRREANERMRRSLGSLSAFARIQASLHPDDTDAAIRQVLIRIDALMQLHEAIHRNAGDEKIALCDYLNSATEMMQQLAPSHVTIEIKADRVDVRAAQAVAAGTFINEFVSTSLRNALSDKSPLTIEVSLVAEADGRVRLCCREIGGAFMNNPEERLRTFGIGTYEIVSLELEAPLDLRAEPDGIVAELVFQPDFAG